MPENYIRVWNPVDDVGDNDMNEVNVDDDVPFSDHRLNYTYANHSDSEFTAALHVWFDVHCVSKKFPPLHSL